MPTRSNTMAIVAEIEAISRNLDGILRPVIQGAASSAQSEIMDEWPNPSNSGPQASGRPSQSTGLSSSSWRRRVDRLMAVVYNGVDYADYVHFTGDLTGQAVEDAREIFDNNFEAVADVMADTVADALNSVG